MNKSFSLLANLTIPLVVFAQSYNVQWGPEYEKPGSIYSSYSLAGFHKDGFFMLMQPKKGHTIAYYDYSGREKYQKEALLKYEEKELNLRDIISTKTKSFAYIPLDDKKESKHIILAAELLSNGLFGPVKKIHETKFSIEYKYTLFGLLADTDADIQSYVVSADSNYVAFASALSSKDKKKPDLMNVAVFNSDLQMIWEKQQEFPYSDKSLSLQDFIVTNKGDVFFSAKLWRSPAERQDNKPYEFKIFSITKGGMKEYDINIGSTIRPHETGLFVDKSVENVFLGGMYIDLEKKSGIHGVFFSKLNFATGKVTSSTNAFSATFLDSLISDKAIAKGKGLSKGYRIDHFITFNDNSFSFIAEETYITTKSYTLEGKSYSYTYYHSDGIIIPRFTADGELLAIEKIDKELKYTDPRFTSYSFAVANNKVYLVYNSNKSWKELKEIREKGEGKLMQVTDLTVLGPTGKKEYQGTLFTNQESDAFYYPKMSFHHGDKLMLFTYFKKSYRWGMLDISK